MRRYLPFLLLLGCQAPRDIDFCAGVGFRHASPSTKGTYLAHDDPRIQVGAGYDYIQMVPLSANPIGGGTAGVWSKTTTGRVQMTDTSGNVLEAGEARKLYQSAGAPATLATGDIWYDTSSNVISYRDNSATRSFPAAQQVCTLNTAQTIASTKTWSADQVITDNTYDFGSSTQRWQQIGAMSVLSGTSTLALTSNVADGATAIATTITNSTTLSNATARMLSLVNSSEVMAVRYDGAILAPSAGTSFSAQHAFPSGTGAVVSTDATQTLTNKTLTSPTIGTGWTLASNLVVYDTVQGNIAGALGAATDYMTGAGVAATTTEYPLRIVKRSSTARLLYCYLGTAPGGADTVVFTVRKNGSDQSLLCTISAASTTCNDTSNTFSAVAADRISIKAVSSAGTAANAACSLELAN